jgi:flavin-dependent dehydrogenase
LVRAGLEVRVLDRSQFPRDKICAGWITPAVVHLLDLDVADYRRGGRVFQPITGFQTSLMGSGQVKSSYDHAISFGIRRCEFDDYLLKRSGATLDLGEPVRSIRRDTSTSATGSWIINERVAASMLVGAGGHYCPVARFLNGASRSWEAGTRRVAPRSACGGSEPAKPSARLEVCPPRLVQGSGRSAPREGAAAPPQRRGICEDSGLVVAQEIEFVMSPEEQRGCRVDPEMPELYFCEDLDGYGWCFRKADVLNIGLGRRGSDGRRLSAEVEQFATSLRRWGRIDFDLPHRLRGHAYLLSDQSPRRRIDDGVLLIGDAAGMAYPASGEGIRPAVETGLLAAAAIRAAAARGGRFQKNDLEGYERAIVSRFGRPRPAVAGREHRPPNWQIRLGQWLLSRPWFARHVVMDRWFLHTHEPPLGHQDWNRFTLPREESAHSAARGPAADRPPVGAARFRKP